MAAPALQLRRRFRHVPHVNGAARVGPGFCLQRIPPQQLRESSKSLVICPRKPSKTVGRKQCAQSAPQGREQENKAEPQDKGASTEAKAAIRSTSNCTDSS